MRIYAKFFMDLLRSLHFLALFRPDLFSAVYQKLSHVKSQTEKWDNLHLHILTTFLLGF